MTAAPAFATMTSMSLWFQETLFTRHIRVKGFANNWTGSVGSCDKSPEDVGFFFSLYRSAALFFFLSDKPSCGVFLLVGILWALTPFHVHLGVFFGPGPAGIQDVGGRIQKASRTWTEQHWWTRPPAVGTWNSRTSLEHQLTKKDITLTW